MMHARLRIAMLYRRMRAVPPARFPRLLILELNRTQKLLLTILNCSLAILGFSQSPTISFIPSQRTFPMLPTRPIPFVISEPNTPADALLVSAASADTLLIPPTNIFLGGSGSNRTIRLLPVGLKGTNSITISVQDTNGMAASETFQLTIADFTDIGGALQQLDGASVAWGDYDNDGLLDLLITGSPWIGYRPEVTKIYHNNGDGTFTDINANLVGVLGGGAVWGDYNNDGRLDVMLAGLTGAVSGLGDLRAYDRQRIYRNDGSNAFALVAAFENPNGGAGYPAGRDSSLAWGDYDNDGKLDVLIKDWPFSVFAHNDGNDSFTPGNLSLPGAFNTSVAWADYNNDGNLDFVLTTLTATTLYQNTGGGIFSQLTNSLPGVWVGSVAWEDYDNDGNFDLAIVGGTNGVYAGDGAGNFTRISITLPGGPYASVAWGDIDNDGLPDIIVTSSSGTQILHNNGDGSFSDMGVALPGAGNGGVALGDFDNDGCLDIAIAGGGITKIFRNDGAMPNTPPNPPSNLAAAPSTNAMVFSWSAASDAQQAGGLSYNLRVGTSSGGIDVVGPMADPVTGVRRLPALGNAGLRLSRSVTHLKQGTYYWSVQAVDHTFAGSAFAPEQHFTLVGPTINSQPSSQTNITGTVSFTVAADGTKPVSYQWYGNGAIIEDSARISGATSTNLTISNVQGPDLGNYYVVVGNLCGSITSIVANLTTLPPVVISQPQDQITWIGGARSFSATASGNGPLGYQWQFNGTNLPGATNNPLTLTGVHMDQFGPYDLVVSNSYGTAVSGNALLLLSQVAFWADPLAYQAAQLTPGLTNIVAIAAGPTGPFECEALKDDGTVVTWPTRRPLALSNLVAIAGAEPGLGLQADGTVVNLGYSPPLLVSGLSNIVAIALYNYGYLGLMAKGTVTGTASIAGLSNVVAISEGQQHSVALKADGSVVTWGNNSLGQTNVPLGLTNVVAISAGYFHNLALRGDSTVVAWGANNDGQTSVPVGLTNVVAVAAGGYHSLALRADGTVVAWGANNYQQTNVPAGLRNVVAIAAGDYFSMALLGSRAGEFQVLLRTPRVVTNGASIFLPTQSGRVYVLQYKDALSDVDWASLPLQAGSGGLEVLTDSTGIVSNRFYRVLRW